MKKVFVIVLTVILCISLVGCGGKKSESATDSIGSLDESETLNEKVVDTNEESSINEHSNFMGIWYYTDYTDPIYAEDFWKIEIIPYGEDKAKVLWGDGHFGSGKSDIIEFISEDKAIGAYAGISKACYIVSTIDEVEHFNVDVAEDGPIFEMGVGGYREIPDLYKPKAVRIKGDFQAWFDTLSQKEIPDAPQQTMNVKSKEIYDEWDRMLNEIYQYLKESMSQDEFAALQIDEQNWISQKEAAIKEQGAEYEGGSIAPLMMNSVGIQYTKERCQYLISLIK